jgi:hypothetical protein
MCLLINFSIPIMKSATISGGEGAEAVAYLVAL